MKRDLDGSSSWRAGLRAVRGFGKPAEKCSSSSSTRGEVCVSVEGLLQP